MLDVSDSSREDGAPILLWHLHNGPNQQFKLVAKDGDYYCIQNVNSGKVADWSDKMLQWEMRPADHQRFKLNPTSDGYYTIEFKKGAGWVMEGMPEKGIVLSKSNNSPSQEFRFVKP